MIRRPPRSTPFPTRRSSDLKIRATPPTRPSKAIFVASGESTARLTTASALNPSDVATRSEEHTSELQSRQYLVCRLLLEKKKKHYDELQDHTPAQARQALQD